MIHLIVNADDFGLRAEINQGIVEAHEEGIVTSASLMVRQPAAEEAARYARRRPALGLGLHVDLQEWMCREGEWHLLYDRVPGGDPQQIEREIRQQIERFRRLVGRDPDHIDSHQHVHRKEPAQSILVALGQKLRVPVRHFSHVRYCGDFYGQSDEGASFPALVGVEGLLSILERLEPGHTELACHPGRVDAPDLAGETMYRLERNLERETLTDRRVRAALDRRGIVLCTFAHAGTQHGARRA